MHYKTANLVIVNCYVRLPEGIFSCGVYWSLMKFPIAPPPAPSWAEDVGEAREPRSVMKKDG